MNPDELPAETPPGSQHASGPRPGTRPSAPSASHYAVELPYAEELQALLEGRYIVESFLGQGGMGAVYRGLQMPLKRPVAIKILGRQQEGEVDDFGFEERFKREAYAMAALTHPNIVQVYDCGDAGENFLFISMELVEGGDLSDAIKNGQCTPEAALALIPQICDGLQAAHERGLVHRDIKPANIFLTADGKPKVADFGLAKKFDAKSTFMTKTGLGMGTPDYAAPEQYDAVEDLDHRADIYALGVMFYQMLTGQLPRGAYKPPSQRVPIDPRLDAVVEKAMEQDRDARYQSAAELKADVQEIVATWMQSAQPVANPPSATRTSAVPTPHRPGTQMTMRTGPVQHLPQTTHQPPPPEKSKAGLMIGVLGAVAAIAAGAFFLVKKPQPSPATVGTGSEVEGAWVDMLPLLQAPLTVTGIPDRRKNGEWSLASGAVSVKSAGAHEAVSIPVEMPASYDLSLRMVTEGIGISHMGVLLPIAGHMVKVNTIQHYGGSPDGITVILKIAEGSPNPIPLKIKPSFLQANAERLVEFAVRTGGDSASITVKADGQSVFEWSGPQEKLNDDGEHSPNCPRGKVALTASMSANAIWREVRYRKVTGAVVTPVVASAPSSTMPPPSPAAPATPVIATMPPPAAPPSATPGTWQPVITGEMKRNPNITVLPDGWVRVEKAYFNAPPGRDFALRTRMRFTGGNYLWPFRFRDTPSRGLRHYGLSITRDGKVLLHRRMQEGSQPTADDRSLEEVKNQRPLGDGTEFDLEVTAQGDRLMVKLDGATIINERDTFHQGSRTQFGADTAVVEFKNLEWRDLSGSPVLAADAPKPPAASAAPTPGAVNVLTNVDVARDRVTGDWAMVNGELVSNTMKEDSSISLPITEIPAEYDLRYRLTRESGFAMHFQFRQGELRGVFRADGWTGNKSNNNETYVRFHHDPANAVTRPNMLLRDGKTHELVLQVRADRVAALLDGSEVLASRAPLSANAGSGVVPDIGLSVSRGKVVFHAIELVPVAGAASAPVVAPAATAPAPRDPPASADPQLVKLESGFKSRLQTDAEKPFLDAVGNLNRSYAANGLTRARAAAQAAGNLAEVTALDAEKARIEKGEGVPPEDTPDTPASLKQLRGTYRAALAKLEADRAKNAATLYDLYLRALDSHISELTKANKIIEAGKVQTIREGIAQEHARLTTLAAPPIAANTVEAQAIPQATTPKTPKPAPTEPVVERGGSAWKAAATYLAGNGGSLVVLKGNQRITVAKPEEVPPGKLDIHEITLDRLNSPLPSPKDADFQALLGLRDLRRVWVRNTDELTDAAFAFLAGNEELAWMNLERPGKVTDGILVHLADAKKLQVLKIQHAPAFTGKGLARMPFAGTVTEVDFLNTGLDDEGVKELSTFKELGNIRITGSSATDASFAELALLKKLAVLHIAETAFGDQAAAAVSTLANLTELDVKRTSLTDAGLRKLTALKNLRTLALRGSKVTPEAVAEFQKMMPKCTVSF